MGNKTARDFFWFYFSSIFQWKYLGTTFLVAGGHPPPPALNDSPVIIRLNVRVSKMKWIFCSHWLFEWARWAHLAVGSERNGSLFGNINKKCFIDQVCLVKMARYQPASFFLASLLTSHLSGYINIQKRAWLILCSFELTLSLSKQICTDIKLVGTESHLRGKVTYLLLKSRHRTLVSCFRICRGNGLLINIFMIWLNHKQETISTIKTYH